MRPSAAYCLLISLELQQPMLLQPISPNASSVQCQASSHVLLFKLEMVMANMQALQTRFLCAGLVRAAAQWYSPRS